MITFKQFILEDDFSPEDLAEIIKVQCAPYLEIVQDLNPSYWLKHGTNNTPSNQYWFKKNTPVEREPKDTSLAIHKIMDDFMLKKHGERFRSNSLFCVSADYGASEYGYPYFVFPVGNFQYCWSKHVGDASTFFDNSASGSEPDGSQYILSTMGIEEYDFKNEDPKSWEEILRGFFNRKDLYKTTDLTDALKNYPSNEIMVKCNSAYFVKMKNLDSDDFLDHLLEIMPK